MNSTTINNHSDWESLIAEVDKSNIPLEFVNFIDVDFYIPINDEESLTLDIRKLRAEGYSDSDIEAIVQTTINGLDDNVKSIQFFLDIDHVASTIQFQTDQILKTI